MLSAFSSRPESNLSRPATQSTNPSHRATAAEEDEEEEDPEIAALLEPVGGLRSSIASSTSGFPNQNFAAASAAASMRPVLLAGRTFFTAPPTIAVAGGDNTQSSAVGAPASFTSPLPQNPDPKSDEGARPPATASSFATSGFGVGSPSPFSAGTGGADSRTSNAAANASPSTNGRVSAYGAIPDEQDLMMRARYSAKKARSDLWTALISNTFVSKNGLSKQDTNVWKHTKEAATAFMHTKFFGRLMLVLSFALVVFLAYRIGGRHVDFDAIACRQHLASRPDEDFHQVGDLVCVRPPKPEDPETTPAGEIRYFRSPVIDTVATRLQPGALKTVVAVDTSFCTSGIWMLNVLQQQQHPVTRVPCWSSVVVRHSAEVSQSGDVVGPPYSSSLCAALYYTSIDEFCKPIEQRQIRTNK